MPCQRASGGDSGHASCPAVTDWLVSFRPSQLSVPTYTEAALTAARQYARRCEAACARFRTAQWVSWLYQGPASGLGRQHAYSRLPHGWVPTRVASRSSVAAWREHDLHQEAAWLRRRSLTADEDGVMQPLNAQEVVDVEALDWAEHWKAGQEQPPCPWPAHIPVPEHPLTPQELLAAADTFPDGTGLNWERFHPKAIRRLSLDLLARLADLFAAIERHGRWPAAVAWAIIVLLAKPDGGFRPIGLLPWIVRLWTRARRQVAIDWERAHHRPYFFAGQARGADVAAWRQAARAEAAAATTASYAQSLLDVVKAFEAIPHDWLVREALAHQYPLWLLRLSVASYKLGRVIRISGVYSAVVYACRGITAGAGLATTEMRLILISFCDYTTSQVPGTVLTVFVDDVGVEHTATAANVVRRQVRALGIIGRAFTRLRMALSDSKGVVTASTPTIAAAVSDGAARVGVVLRAARSAKSLGHGLGAGVRRCSKVLRKRLTAFRARRPLFWALRRAGVHGAKLVRTGGAAAMQYGQSHMGVAPSMLHAQRVATVAVVAAGARGRDLDLTLIAADTQASHRTDPAFAAHMDPITKWAQAVWYSWMPISVMNTMVARVRARITAAKRVWHAITGPAAATVATAGRIGWTLHSAAAATTDDGRHLYFDLDPPAVIAAHVAASVRRWQWRRVAAKHPALSVRDGFPPPEVVFEPIRRLLAKDRPDENWMAHHRAALSSALCGGQWPQARLYAAGLVEHPYCVLCYTAATTAQDEGAMVDWDQVPIGTIRHRMLCPHLQDVRDFAAPRTIVQDMVADLSGPSSPHQIKWTRALVAVPPYEVPPPSQEETFCWITPLQVTPNPRVFYVDASGVDPLDPRTRRVGWSLVVVDSVGSAIIGSASGLPPPWIDGTGGAEAWALYQASLHAEPPDTFVTDCLGTVRALMKGKQAATAAHVRLARVNRLLYTHFDTPEDARRVVWMPAHRAAHEVGIALKSDGSCVTAIDRTANALADRLAKSAAAQHRVPDDIRERIAEDQLSVRTAAMMLARITHAANNRPTPPRRDSAPTDRLGAWARPCNGRRSGGRTRTRGASQRPAALGGHTICRHLNGWRCTTCRKRSTRWHLFAPQQCEGSATARWARRAVQIAAAGDFGEGRGHVRYAYGEFVWCASCGAYADKFAVGLARPCPGRPLYSSRAAQLRRLQQGRHPLSGISFGVQAEPEHPRADGGTVRYPSGRIPVREAWGSVAEPRPPQSAAASHVGRPGEGGGAGSAPSDAGSMAPRRRMDDLRRRVLAKARAMEDGLTCEDDRPARRVAPAPNYMVGGSSSSGGEAGPCGGVAALDSHHRALEPAAASEAEVITEYDDVRGTKRRRLLLQLAAGSVSPRPCAGPTEPVAALSAVATGTDRLVGSCNPPGSSRGASSTTRGSLLTGESSSNSRKRLVAELGHPPARRGDAPPLRGAAAVTIAQQLIRPGDFPVLVPESPTSLHPSVEMHMEAGTADTRPLPAEAGDRKRLRTGLASRGDPTVQDGTLRSEHTPPG